MNERIHIPAETLRQLLDYNPETGRFYWKARDASWFSEAANPQKAADGWNRQYAGAETFLYRREYGYRYAILLGHHIRAHRAAYAMVHGVWPANDIDHINGDTGDNRIANLRDVTTSENMRNKRRYKNNRSGTAGVYWEAKAGVWCAKIAKRHLGSFKNKEDAISARKRAEVSAGYMPNHGRDGG